MSATWLFHIRSHPGPSLGSTSIVTAFCDLCGPNTLYTHTSYSLIFLIDADGHEGLCGQASPYAEAQGCCAEIMCGTASVSPSPQPVIDRDPLQLLVICSLIHLGSSIHSPFKGPLLFS